MVVSGKASDMIHPTALAVITLAAVLTHTMPRFRHEIEAAYWIGLPLYCAFGAVTDKSLQIVGDSLALGLCGAVYGLIWFGLEQEGKAPAWRRWMTAVPLLALAGICFPVRQYNLTTLYDGPGLGPLWLIEVALAAGSVAAVGMWRRSAPDTAIWSFAAAVTLCMSVRAFQLLELANVVDIVLIFVPYVTALLTTVARPALLLPDAVNTEPVGEQLRPLG